MHTKKQKITAIIMSFVVVFSTLSFSYSAHFCGEHLVDVGLFSKAENCGMAMEVASSYSDCNAFKKNCCSDKVKQFEGQTNLKIDFESFTFNQQKLIAAFVQTYVASLQSVEIKAPYFKNYKPPLVEKDIAVLFQVFRI